MESILQLFLIIITRDIIKDFLFATDIVEGFEDVLKFITMDHYNTWIYSAKFKII
jgi:hypothetical protein